MPVYEFECEDCGQRFEELVPSDTRACPALIAAPSRRGGGSRRFRRRRPARGAKVRSDESRRGEREAARGERLTETKRKRAKGEP